VVSSAKDIQNPLIREVLKYHDVRDHIDFHSSADVPSRTGLGGSSSFCAGMVHLMKKLKDEPVNKKDIAKTAIHIERNILKDSSGIQDQILAAYGGFNTIEIDRKGNFTVKPLPVSDGFKKSFETLSFSYIPIARETKTRSRSRMRIKTRKRYSSLREKHTKHF
jgi:D-glycero-alpha-D-manno-heptose-7-phosphate kinase